MVSLNSFSFSLVYPRPPYFLAPLFLCLSSWCFYPLPAAARRLRRSWWSFRREAGSWRLSWRLSWARLSIVWKTFILRTKDWRMRWKYLRYESQQDMWLLWGWRYHLYTCCDTLLELSCQFCDLWKENNILDVTTECLLYPTLTVYIATWRK